ncbi:hypothetical protein R3P38DRAFT_2827064 [Favolaschia claudopus]|uniref:Uncharacterized protein n=1 Tax=Favolaschia claudopus TaxID=2862362 RepID=A0AAW0EJJ4_9AGAR
MNAACSNMHPFAIHGCKTRSVHSSPSRLMVPMSSTHTKRASIGTSFFVSELPYDVVRATTPPTSLPVSPTSVIRWKQSQLLVSTLPSPLPDIPAESMWYPAKQWIPNYAGHDTYMDYNRSPHLVSFASSTCSRSLQTWCIPCRSDALEAHHFEDATSSSSDRFEGADVRAIALLPASMFPSTILSTRPTLAVSCRIILSEVSDPPIKGQTQKPNNQLLFAKHHPNAPLPDHQNRSLCSRRLLSRLPDQAAAHRRRRRSP